MKKAPWGWIIFAALAAYPLLGADGYLTAKTGVPLEKQFTTIFIFALLSLGLNVVVGQAGLLQLGIAAFFAIGAYVTGILTVSVYPFQVGFWGALVIAPIVAGLAGVVLAAPTLRLRGDYLAIVTLGFGEVVRVTLINLEEITGGPRGLNPLPPPWVPGFMKDGLGWKVGEDGFLGIRSDFYIYYVALAALVGTVLLLRVIERSRIGRSWIAIREDELAATCMGINAVRTKLSAFAMGAALAGLAGVLYATKLTTTAEPNTYDFNYSIMVLCCLIIGGLGSTPGVLLGAFVLLGFDNVLTPLMTKLIQKSFGDLGTNVMAAPSNWRWIIFGAALVLMMRYRPEGIIPSKRAKLELHEEKTDPEVNRVGVE